MLDGVRDPLLRSSSSVGPRTGWVAGVASAPGEETMLTPIDAAAAVAVQRVLRCGQRPRRSCLRT
eukprot:COSAG02_NODE_4602_length_5176_cov_2.578885_2_plen_65_part_00